MCKLKREEEEEENKIKKSEIFCVYYIFVASRV
jgi:hypothetical protein